jgi:hypothetical protein
VINEILVQDEDGRTEASFPDPHALHDVLSSGPDDSHCLQYIDPWGDTVFNRAQTDRLIRELEAQAMERSPELRHHLQRLLTFLRPVVDRPHLYVKFVGD